MSFTMFHPTRSFICLLGCLLVSPAAGASYEALFPVKKHDFGTVAVSAKTEFRFPIVNNTDREIHIRTVRASCGCTTPIVETEYIGPGETGSILARYNTDTFRGKKGATLTVVVDRPSYGEVRLRVDGYIRRDLVFHPGQVDFGNVAVGRSATETCQVSYAGRSDWRIVDVRSNQPWIRPKFNETLRQNGSVKYDLTVELREDAPAGMFQDQLVVITDDRSMPRIPIRVSGDIQSAVQVAPQLISLGSVKDGESVAQRLVIRGRDPFVIESIECPGWKVDFERSQEPKKMHIISTTFQPVAAQGTQKVRVIVTTRGESGSAPANALLTAVVAER